MKPMLRAALLLLLAPAAPLPAQAPAAPPAAAAAQDTSLLARATASRFKGAADAPVTIVEVSDFQCPFCREFAETTLPQLDSAYIQTGRVRLIFLNYPLPNHPRAWLAAEAALCAGAQDGFWPMHDRLFAEQRAWGTAADPAALLEGYARELGLDLEAYRRCTAQDEVAPILVGDLLQVAQSGIRGTPTFIFNGETARSGALTLEEMAAEIERLEAAR